MLVLGLQGSPRLKGNTNDLLSLFLRESEKQGAETLMIQVSRKNILPCREILVCEKKGFCPIDDDMKTEIYPLLRKADVVIAASPIFFYGVTAQFKALIDRSQTLWARKYRLKLKDPKWQTRKGFLLSVGATRGKNLFEGAKLSVSYFFDAIDARFEGSLTYRKIEAAGSLKEHPTVREDVRKAAAELLDPLLKRKKIPFFCRNNAALSQMAAAFTQYHAGSTIEAAGAGFEPADRTDPAMVAVMGERGIDMAFRKPQSFEQAHLSGRPDVAVALGPTGSFPESLESKRIQWDLPDPGGKSIEFMRKVRDIIENHVMELIRTESESGI
ncbi:MAG: flavin reductase [Desulfobacteraceae bacterium]|nr:MAG: flavin reductase [Desulfobacteraceae bacterium]